MLKHASAEAAENEADKTFSTKNSIGNRHGKKFLAD